MATATRKSIERQIVSRAVNDLLAAGFRLSVSLERGYDLDEMLLGSRDATKITEEAMAGDECHLFVHEAEGPLTDGEGQGSLLSLGWVYFVYGNDGWDAISDYTQSIETHLKSALKYSEDFCNGYVVPGSVYEELIGALIEIREMRDAFANNPRLSDGGKCFDDWAADRADAAIKDVAGVDLKEAAAITKATQPQ